MKKIGFIDYYLDEWHANNYPTWIKEASDGNVQVAYAYGLKDAEHGISNTAWCEQQGITQLATVEEVVALSDYLIVLSPDHPEQHEVLAEIPLASGKPTYIDKSFAPDRAAARRMFERAGQFHTPLYSSSALRFATEYVDADREGIQLITSWGPGKFDTYAIHQLEPIASLMGTDARRIMFIGTTAAPAIMLEFSNGRQATIQHPGPGSPFMMSLHYTSGQCSVVQANSNFFQLFIRDLLQFFETGRSNVPQEETIAIITWLEYGQLAAKHPYQWIDLPTN